MSTLKRKEKEERKKATHKSSTWKLDEKQTLSTMLQKWETTNQKKTNEAGHSKHAHIHTRSQLQELRQ